jgi:hypothetical protein
MRPFQQISSRREEPKLRWLVHHLCAKLTKEHDPGVSSFSVELACTKIVIHLHMWWLYINLQRSTTFKEKWK